MLKFTALFIVLLNVAGCATSSSSGSRSNQASAPRPLTVAEEYQRQEVLVGFPEAWVSLAQSIDLTDDQKKQLIDIASKVRRDTQPVRVARRHLAPLLADSVESGHFELLDSEFDKVLALSKKHDAARVEAFNHLHTLLTPVQRQKLADSVRALDAQRKQTKKNEEDQVRLLWSQIGTYIDLTDDEREEIRNIFAKRGNEFAPNLTAEMQMADETRAALLEAFPKDDFDASVLNLEPPSLREKFQRSVAFIAELTKALRPKQRAQLAALVRRQFGVVEQSSPFANTY